MKPMKAIMFLSLLLPLSAWGGVIFGNVTLLDANKEKPAGDTLRVILIPDDGSLSAEQLANPEKGGADLAASDTTNAYAAYNVFVDGTGTYKIYLYGQAKASLLATPLAVQIYDEPVEYNLILSPTKDGAFKYQLRRK